MDLERRGPNALEQHESPPAGIDISIERLDDRTVSVRVAGELDLSTSKTLERELEGVLGDSSRTAIVLNLSDLAFLDSTGLRALWTARQHALAAGGTLVLDEPSDTVMRILTMTKLDKVFLWKQDDEGTVHGGRAV